MLVVLITLFFVNATEAQTAKPKQRFICDVCVCGPGWAICGEDQLRQGVQCTMFEIKSVFLLSETGCPPDFGRIVCGLETECLPAEDEEEPPSDKTIQVLTTETSLKQKINDVLTESYTTGINVKQETTSESVLTTETSLKQKINDVLTEGYTTGINVKQETTSESVFVNFSLPSSPFDFPPEFPEVNSSRGWDDSINDHIRTLGEISELIAILTVCSIVGFVLIIAMCLTPYLIRRQRRKRMNLRQNNVTYHPLNIPPNLEAVENGYGEQIEMNRGRITVCKKELNEINKNQSDPSALQSNTPSAAAAIITPSQAEKSKERGGRGGSSPPEYRPEKRSVSTSSEPAGFGERKCLKNWSLATIREKPLKQQESSGSEDSVFDAELTTIFGTNDGRNNERHRKLK